MSEFSHKIDIEKQLCNEKGHVFIEASEHERQALAARFGFLNIENLTLTGKIEDKKGRGYLFKGKINATITQACIETQKPVTESIAESLKVFLVYTQAAEVDDYSVDEEVIEKGGVDFGEIAAQYLSLGADPYPLCKEF